MGRQIPLECVQMADLQTGKTNIFQKDLCPIRDWTNVKAEDNISPISWSRTPFASPTPGSITKAICAT
jgi:hypothetical protein